MFEPLSDRIANANRARKEVPLDKPFLLEYSYGYEAALNQIMRDLLNESSSPGCDDPGFYLRLAYGNAGQPDKGEEPGDKGSG